MLNQDFEHLERAGEYWRGGQPLEAGRLIFENLPAQVRPRWASKILRLAVGRSGSSVPPIDHLLEIADRPTEWGNAHRVFSLLRKSTLDLERLQNRTPEQEIVIHNLYLAENVAKVIYNSTDPPDEFDEDSGWWVVACLRGIVDWWNDEEFSEEAWSALCFDGG